jgi:uncharacterized protein YjbI with pentapeptide repeats
MAKLTETGLQEVQFKRCKLVGVTFEYCDDFLLSFSFEACNLSFTSFHQKKIEQTQFSECNLEGADFIKAQLKGAVFENCNLQDAKFEQTDLSAADFRTATGFRIDPDLNKISKAQFSRNNIEGLLWKYEVEIE